MDNRQQHHGGGSLNTFLFGVLVGILASLLFTTKKGRRLLKVITDEGVDRLTHWEDMLKSMEREIEEDTLDEEPVIGEDMEKEVRALEAPKTEEVDENEPAISEKPDEEENPAPKKKSKRLFKGIRRKAS